MTNPLNPAGVNDAEALRGRIARRHREITNPSLGEPYDGAAVNAGLITPQMIRDALSNAHSETTRRLVDQIIDPTRERIPSIDSQFPEYRPMTEWSPTRTLSDTPDRSITPEEFAHMRASLAQSVAIVSQLAVTPPEQISASDRVRGIRADLVLPTDDMPHITREMEQRITQELRMRGNHERIMELSPPPSSAFIPEVSLPPVTVPAGGLLPSREIFEAFSSDSVDAAAAAVAAISDYTRASVRESSFVSAVLTSATSRQPRAIANTAASCWVLWARGCGCIDWPDQDQQPRWRNPWLNPNEYETLAEATYGIPSLRFADRNSAVHFAQQSGLTGVIPVRMTGICYYVNLLVEDERTGRRTVYYLTRFWGQAAYWIRRCNPLAQFANDSTDDLTLFFPERQTAENVLARLRLLAPSCHFVEGTESLRVNNFTFSVELVEHTIGLDVPTDQQYEAMTERISSHTRQLLQDSHIGIDPARGASMSSTVLVNNERRTPPQSELYLHVNSIDGQRFTAMCADYDTQLQLERLVRSHGTVLVRLRADLVTNAAPTGVGIISTMTQDHARRLSTFNGQLLPCAQTDAMVNWINRSMTNNASSNRRDTINLDITLPIPIDSIRLDLVVAAEPDTRGVKHDRIIDLDGGDHA
jgi:hypothetical protein